MTDDPHDLQRFVDAQGDGVYERALSELVHGQKQSHWMWFVFPQIAGLGGSAMAEMFAVASLDEARAYLAHPVLGPRLIECVATATGIDGRPAEAIFGFPDVLKFRSCLTLFTHAAPDQAVFTAALAKFYDGKQDERSLALLGLG